VEVVAMGGFKVLRGVGVAACLAMGLSLVLVSGTFAASRPRTDVFAQQATLTASDQIGTSFIGSAVALSSDGKTALVGGPGDNEEVGAAWLFKLTGGGETGRGHFGASLALSSDGRTALIGGPGDNEAIGAAWVFKRSGSTWDQQGEKLTANDEEAPSPGFGGGSFGASVALSADGNTALIGGPRDRAFDFFASGAVWVFTRSDSTWAQQGPKLLITSTSENAIDREVGQRVSLSGDGNTALIQAQNSESSHGNGGAWVFTRLGSTWTQGPLLMGGWESDSMLSSGGNTALIEYSSSYYCCGPGGARVFTRSGSTWTQQGPELTNGEDRFGSLRESDAALSGDGNTALIRDSTHPGVLVFTRSGSTWTQQVPSLAPTCRGEPCGGVALSLDADTALVGTTVFVKSHHE
jgi:hypothetical protein